MKKIILAVLVIGVFGCKEVVDEPTGPGKTDPVVEGTWNFISLNHTNGNIKVGGFDVSTFVATSSNPLGTFIFDNGTVTSNISYTDNRTTTTAGFPQETTENIVEANTGTYTHTAGSNTMTFTVDGETVTADILTLTEDTFSYKVPYSKADTVGMITTLTTSDATITLAK
jgi:hypothetical protein